MKLGAGGRKGGSTQACFLASSGSAIVESVELAIFEVIVAWPPLYAALCEFATSAT